MEPETKDKWSPNAANEIGLLTSISWKSITESKKSKIPKA